MNEFVFEPTAWELTLEKIETGTSLSAARFLTLMEGEEEPAVEEALLELEQKKIMLDVTDLPEVQVGDVATVFGTGAHGEPTVTELAELAGTIPYELLCGVSLRVPRIYM